MIKHRWYIVQCKSHKVKFLAEQMDLRRIGIYNHQIWVQTVEPRAKKIKQYGFIHGIQQGVEVIFGVEGRLLDIIKLGETAVIHSEPSPRGEGILDLHHKVRRVGVCCCDLPPKN